MCVCVCGGGGGGGGGEEKLLLVEMLFEEVSFKAS